MKIGLQVYSICDDAEKDFVAAMKKVKEMGYDGVELIAEKYGYTAEEMKKILDDVGLIAFSAHVPLGNMAEDPDATMKFYKTLGCKYVAVPWLAELTPGTEGFEKTVSDMRLVGKKAREYGMQLLYHNHDFEFVKYDGEYVLDMLYRLLTPEELQTELDTCWVNVGGENPAAYLLKYAGRAPVVHLKDFYKEDGASKDDMYELIGVEKKANQTAAFEFRPVGHGMQKFVPIVAAAEKAGADWVVVEQDRPSLGLTPMECADLSRKYLRSIGL